MRKCKQTLQKKMYILLFSSFTMFDFSEKRFEISCLFRTVDIRSQAYLLWKSHNINDYRVSSLSGLVTQQQLAVDSWLLWCNEAFFFWLMTPPPKRRDGCLKRGRETNVSFQRACITFTVVHSNIHPNYVENRADSRATVTLRDTTTTTKQRSRTRKVQLWCW